MPITELFTLRTGAIIRDRYQIVSVLGVGGFAITYRAYDRALRADVAVKEYFPQAYAERSTHDYSAVICRSGENRSSFDEGLLRFKQEAERTASLKGRHNVIDVFDYCEQNGTAYMIMEYLVGMTLTDYLRTLPDERMQDMEDAARIIYAVAEGLSYIHTQKMLHRDISPDNIFLLLDGSVRLIDFGAALNVSGETQHSVIVKAGCTPPEQYRRNGKQGPWTDMYALGATLYRMLTGTFPDPAPDRQHNNGSDLIPACAVNAAVPEYLDVLILRCLALDPHLRPHRAEDVLQVLSQRQRLPNPAQAAKSYQRGKTVLGAAITAVVLLIVVVFINAFMRSETLYSANISECTLNICLPDGTFTTPDGLASLQADFAELYPMVTLNFTSTPPAQASVFPMPEDLSGCAPLQALRKLSPEGSLYAETVAYDAALLYFDVQKAAKRGATRESLKSIIPDGDDLTAKRSVFLDPDNTAYAYRGSIGEYQTIQQALGGLYALQENFYEITAVQLSVSDTLSSNQRQAAERFLLYLGSERAQRILFLDHGGLIPAEDETRKVYFKAYPELEALLAGPTADYIAAQTKIY